MTTMPEIDHSIIANTMSELLHNRVLGAKYDRQIDNTTNKDSINLIVMGTYSHDRSACY